MKLAATGRAARAHHRHVVEVPCTAGSRCRRRGRTAARSRGRRWPSPCARRRAKHAPSSPWRRYSLSKAARTAPRSAAPARPPRRGSCRRGRCEVERADVAFRPRHVRGPRRECRGTAIGVMRRAGAFGRHHARAHRRFGRAPVPNSLQSVGASRRAGWRRTCTACGRARSGRPAETLLGVEALVGRADLQRRVGDLAEAAPLEAERSSKTSLHDRLRGEVALARDRAAEFVLDLGAAFVTWRTSIQIACITSSGSKPAITTGLRYSSAKCS